MTTNNNDRFQQFGLVEWEDVKQPVFNKQPAKPFKKDEWMKLKKGDNYIRLVSKPFQYNVHKFKFVNGLNGDPGYGEKIKCCKTSADSPCPACDLGSRFSQRWYFGIIDRADGRYKIFDMPSSVFTKVDGFRKSAKWGDPQNYDINIVMDPTAAAANYYGVYPDPKEPLSEQDTQIKMTQVDQEGLKKMCQALSLEKASEKIEAYRLKLGKAAPKLVVQEEEEVPTEQEDTQTSASSGDDEQFVFYQDS
jgi:hypothetical protein